MQTKIKNKKSVRPKEGTAEYTDYVFKAWQFINDFDLKTKQYIEHSTIAQNVRDAVVASETSRRITMDDVKIKSIIMWMIGDYMKNYGNIFEYNQYPRDYFRRRATLTFEREFNVKL